MSAIDTNILELDLGNTRIKWRLWFNRGDSRTGAITYGPDLPATIAAAIGPAFGKVDRVRLASVASRERLQLVIDACAELCPAPPQQAEVLADYAGLRPAYGQLENLGVDRWLAMLAALKRYACDCVVVGCGTAVTVDLVTAAGRHLGGYIVPGLDLMREALFQRTGAVRLESLPVPDNLLPADDTVPAVARGSMLMLRALVENARQQLISRQPAVQNRSDLAGSVKIVMTGGDAPTISPFIVGQPVYNEHLVLDGLGIALP